MKRNTLTVLLVIGACYPGRRRPRRGLAQLAGTGRPAGVERAWLADNVESRRRCGVADADPRPRGVVADCGGRSGLSDITLIGRGPLRPGSHPALARGGAESPDDERPLGGQRVDGARDAVVFLVSAFNRVDGRVVWEYEVVAEGDLPQAHQKHNMASPSAVSDGERVYAWFATGQLVALDMRGGLVWQRHLARDYGPFEIVWGHSSSPIHYEDLIILQCDHETGAYLLAVDRLTGEERWKVERGQGLRSFSTPLVVAGPDGAELIVNASEGLDAYDPETGEQLWHTGGHNDFPIASATYDDRGTLYTGRGHRAGPYMAIRLGGRGRRGREPRRVARANRSAVHFVAPLLRGVDLYGQRQRYRDRRRCGDRSPRLAGSRRWHLLGLSGGGRWQGVSLQRDWRDRRAAGWARAAHPAAERPGRAGRLVAGGL